MRGDGHANQRYPEEHDGGKRVGQRIARRDAEYERCDHPSKENGSGDANRQAAGDQARALLEELAEDPPVRGAEGQPDANLARSLRDNVSNQADTPITARPTATIASEATSVACRRGPASTFATSSSSVPAADTAWVGSAS